MREIFQNASMMDRDAQQKCYGRSNLLSFIKKCFLLNFAFFVAFPRGCTFYQGPHTTKCLENIWKNAGCLEGGWQYPGNVSVVSSNQLLNLNSLNIE